MNLKNLMSAEVVALVLAALAAFSGFIAGRQQTTDKIEQTTRDVAALAKRMDLNDVIRAGRTKQYQCAVRTLDRLTEKTHIAAPCALQDGEQ